MRIIISLLLLSSLLNAQQESVYDKVMRTGEIRCGYALWPGILEQDPNTNKLSGIFYDFMEALGQSMQIKIVWAEEVTLGDIPEALNSGRIDAHCAGAWTNPLRGKFVDFSNPILFNPSYAYVRADDKRFDNNINAINSPNITISVTDGESASTIAETDFPLAKKISMPKGTEGAQMVLNIIHNKADVTFCDPALAEKVMKHNPGKIKKVIGNFPLRVFGVGVTLKKGDTKLKETINVATNQLLWTGRVEEIIKKHEKFPGMVLRVKSPF